MDAELKLNAIRREVDEAKSQYDAMKNAFEEQNVLVEHLRGSLTKKDEMIARLEGEIASIDRQHREEIKLLEEEQRSSSLTTEHEMRTLEMEKLRLQDDSRMMRKYEEENVEMKKKFVRLETRIQELESQHIAELADTRAEVIRFKEQLEDTFRAQIKESSERARQKAFENCGVDTKRAVEENSRLHSTLSRQNASMEDLLRRFKRLEEIHKRMKIENDVNVDFCTKQVVQVRKLKEQVMNKEEKMNDLERKSQQQRIELSSVELLTSQLEETRSELEALYEKYRGQTAELDLWKQRAMTLMDQTKSMQLYEEDLDLFQSDVRSEKDESPDEEIKEGKDERLDEYIFENEEHTKQQLLSVWNSGFVDYPSLEPNVDIAEMFQSKNSDSFPPSKKKVVRRTGNMLKEVEKQDERLSVLSKHDDRRKRVVENARKEKNPTPKRFVMTGVPMKASKMKFVAP